MNKLELKIGETGRLDNGESYICLADTEQTGCHSCLFRELNHRECERHVCNARERSDNNPVHFMWTHKK